jgi:hypothetical protein
VYQIISPQRTRNPVRINGIEPAAAIKVITTPTMVNKITNVAAKKKVSILERIAS